MRRVRPKRTKASGFTPSQIQDVENVLGEVNVGAITRSFYEKLAQKIVSSNQLRDFIIKPHQVQDMSRKSKEALPTSLSPVPNSSEAEAVGNIDTAVESTGPSHNGDDSEVDEIEFEARSAKDGSWYDIATILTHRKNKKNAMEVLVRYAGFGAEEDEWVNWKDAVRKRSLPLEPSECGKLDVGSLVLCFREKKDVANHFDATVLEIKRRMHDIRGCRCIYLVRYDHDGTEEKVPLRKLCLRAPKTRSI